MAFQSIFFLILTHIQQSALGLEHNDRNQKENIQFCVQAEHVSLSENVRILRSQTPALDFRVSLLLLMGLFGAGDTGIHKQGLNSSVAFDRN